LLFALALLVRLVGLGEATTEDEDQWMLRSGNFARALSKGAWSETFQVGHPGVTTMWLTTLSLGPQRTRAFAREEHQERLVTQVADFLPALGTARLSFAFLGALLAAGCGLLVWRLFGAGPGIVGGLLLALEPYWSAMSPIVGMDGLLAGLMAASLLAALLAFPHSSPIEAAGTGSHQPALSIARAGFALSSGLLAGLALLTKGPAFFLLPIAPILALLEVGPAPRRPGAWRAAGLKLVLWSAALLTPLALWPAFWADPPGTLRRTITFILRIGQEPHPPGNFFFGQPLDDPGPFFYPLAIALRLGPGTIVGLVLLAALRPTARWRDRVLALVIYVLLFLLGLTLSPKKVDRYILPLFPIFAILAGLGWWLALKRATDLYRRSSLTASPRPRLPATAPAVVGLVAAGLLQVWPLLGTLPHPIAAFNPLFGGIKAAERMLPVGWGEGLDLVGQELRREPDADQLVIAIWYPLYVNFQAHAPGRVTNISFTSSGRIANQERFDQAHFYVDYIHARQRRLVPRTLRQRQPEFVVTIGGVEYARVYRLPSL
jgi:hypothetical protein